MMMTSPVPTPVTNNNTEKARDSQKRKKKKLLKQSCKDQSIQNSFSNDNQITEWKSEKQQQVYRTKLFKALRQLRQGSGPGEGAGAGTAVRETADRVLAVTAKGRTRWSRAILTNKLKVGFMMGNRRQRGWVMTETGNSRLKKPKLRILKLKRKKLVVVKKNNLPAVQRKGRVLGGLVPGCQKQPLPVVLKEATDYIPALEMQVKAMAALVELLTGGSGGSGDGSGNLGQLSFSRPPPCL